MDKKELVIIGLLAIVAILVVYHFAWPEKQIVIVEQPAAQPILEQAAPPQEPIIPQEIPAEAPVEQPAETPQAPSTTPEEDWLVFGDTGAAQQPTPTKENLIPKYVEFQLNKIIIPEYFGYAFMPIKEDRIRTFAGKFGPYHFDYRQYVDVELCSYFLNTPEMFTCEKIYELNYIDNFITFVRGYASDEYIGNMAMREFGAYYIVKDKATKEIIAESYVAPIKLVKD